MTTTKKINANGTEISVLLQGNENDYICLTDMARYKDKQRTDYIIQNWMRARNTIEYLGVWEQLHNPNFNPIVFDGFRNQSGLNSFSLTPKEWADKTNAIGIYSKAGRYGGTYAHKDKRKKESSMPPKRICLTLPSLVTQQKTGKKLIQTWQRN